MDFLLLIQVFLAAVVVRSLYRAYFHPLARYPGPFWARCSNVWWFYTFMRGEHHLVEQRLHSQYGSVVRVAPNWLSFSSLEDFEAIYGVNKAIEKDEFYDFGNTDPTRVGSIFSARSEVVHRQKKKKVVGTALTGSKTARYGPIIAKHVDVLLSRMQVSNSNNKPVNMATIFHRFTLDTMFDVLFGPTSLPHPFTDSPVAGDIATELRKTTQMAWACSLWPFFGWITKHPLSRTFSRSKKGKVTGLSSLLAANQEMIFLSPEEIARQSQPGVLKSWLEIPPTEPNRMAPAELFAETINLVIAGPGSTAAALTAVVFQLGTKEGQAWQERIRQEVSATNDNTRPSSCTPILHAVIKETLRFHAPFSTGFPRVIRPGAETACSVLVPAGTRVSANTYVLGRSREVWGDQAEQWQPERWLAEDESQPRETENKFVAFSRGSRGCAGKDLAMLVLATAVQEIVRRWRLVSVGELKGKSYLEMQYDVCDIHYLEPLYAAS